MKLFTKYRLPAIGNKFMVTREEGWGASQGDQIDIYALLYKKYITNKDLLYSRGNASEYSVMAYIQK